MDINDTEGYVVMGIVIITILIVIFACIWDVVIATEDEWDLDCVYSDDEEDIIDMITEDENDDDLE